MLVPLEQIHEQLQVALELDSRTLEEIAEHLGVSSRHLRRVRDGDHPITAVEYLRALGHRAEVVVRVDGRTLTHPHEHGTSSPAPESNVGVYLRGDTLAAMAQVRIGGRLRHRSFALRKYGVIPAIENAVRARAEMLGNTISREDVGAGVRAVLVEYRDKILRHFPETEIPQK